MVIGRRGRGVEGKENVEVEHGSVVVRDANVIERYVPKSSRKVDGKNRKQIRPSKKNSAKKLDMKFEFKKLMTKNKYFAKTLYTHGICLVDITAKVLDNKTDDEIKVVVANLINRLSSNVKILYSLGGRTFWIHNILLVAFQLF
ncbi:hypothetical protein POM88_036967 [Heracleum sosnowskyi]|uniref:Uncharacterized protein n=1 Tax=Heracleum sosnowskyi TaxID=360622 RepID=A0AAD8MCX1_9APIA|nr:hypothetical protein POM88_036967 [Heracleum sosnowskyi]